MTQSNRVKLGSGLGRPGYLDSGQTRNHDLKLIHDLVNQDEGRIEMDVRGRCCDVHHNSWMQQDKGNLPVSTLRPLGARMMRLLKKSQSKLQARSTLEEVVVGKKHLLSCCDSKII